MDYLALCLRTAQECGVPNSTLTTVSGQTGQLKRVCDWVNTAWEDIQTAHQDWNWMRTSTSWATVGGTYAYPLGSGAGTVNVSVATFGMWDRITFRNYVTASGVNSEIVMGYLDYDEWRDNYLISGTRDTRTRPMDFAIGPNKTIYLGPVVSAGYTVTADYFTAPVTLSADADTPALPTHFQMAIVYKAMMHYGAYYAASEVYQRGELEFTKLMRRMDADRLPEIGFAGALA